LLPLRKRPLRDLIATHRPKAVVFYGRKYEPHWQEIAGSSFEVIAEPPAKTAEANGTTFLSIPHPVTCGLKDSFFTGAGHYLASRGIAL
jgi:hypothetical protein